jgi:hypothetical protein
MFPGRKLRSEAGEAGNGQGFWVGIDLDAGVVELHGIEPAREAEPDDGSDGPNGPPPSPDRPEGSG